MATDVLHGKPADDTLTGDETLMSTQATTVSENAEAGVGMPEETTNTEEDAGKEPTIVHEEAGQEEREAWEEAVTTLQRAHDKVMSSCSAEQHAVMKEAEMQVLVAERKGNVEALLKKACSQLCTTGSG